MLSDAGSPVGTVSAIANSLDISCPPTDQALADAATVTGRNAADKDDLLQFLEMLGLPTGEDDLVRLLPLLPDAPPYFDFTDSSGGFTVPSTDTATDTVVDLTDLDQPTTARAGGRRRRHGRPAAVHKRA